MNKITIFFPLNRKICYPTQEKRLLKEFFMTQLSQCVHQSLSFFYLLSSGTLYCSMTWKIFSTARSLYQMDQLDASWLVKGSCNKDCTKFPLSGATWPDCQLRDLQRGTFYTSLTRPPWEWRGSKSVTFVDQQSDFAVGWESSESPRKPKLGFRVMSLVLIPRKKRPICRK